MGLYTTNTRSFGYLTAMQRNAFRQKRNGAATTAHSRSLYQSQTHPKKSHL
jgi:hypothetical protein